MNHRGTGPGVSVVVVTVHESFAETALQQLAGGGFRVSRLAQAEACHPERLREMHPDAALVDHGVLTSKRMPLFQLVRNVLPDCEVILITTTEHAAEAARLAKVWEVFDYVLADCPQDENRIPLLIERATSGCLPNRSTLRGQAKMDSRRVLESLNGLRSILKSKFEGPVVELLHRQKLKDSSVGLQESLAEQLAAEAYQHSIVDMICGRLRRLESLMTGSQVDNQADSSDSNDKQVLVVDDEAVSAETAKFILERSGFNVVSVDSAAAAKRFLEYSVPALILMDVHLGDANGLRLVRVLREKPACRTIPVIVISADTMWETVRMALSVDVQGFVRKPYDAGLLIGKVKNALSEASAEKLAAFSLA